MHKHTHTHRLVLCSPLFGKTPGGLSVSFFPVYRSGQMSRKASAQRGRERERGEGDVLRRKDSAETGTGRRSPPKLPFSFITIPSKNCEWLIWSSHGSLGFETTLHPPFCPSKPRPCPRTPSATPLFCSGPPYPVGTTLGKRRSPRRTPSGSIESGAALSDLACFVWQADRSRANKQNEY